MEDFDRLVKSTLENGTEEVPAGLWEAVQGRLPSASGIIKGVLPFAQGSLSLSKGLRKLKSLTSTSLSEPDTLSAVLLLFQRAFFYLICYSFSEIAFISAGLCAAQ